MGIDAHNHAHDGRLVQLTHMVTGMSFTSGNVFQAIANFTIFSKNPNDLSSRTGTPRICLMNLTTDEIMTHISQADMLIEMMRIRANRDNNR